MKILLEPEIGFDGFFGRVIDEAYGITIEDVSGNNSYSRRLINIGYLRYQSLTEGVHVDNQVIYNLISFLKNENFEDKQIREILMKEMNRKEINGVLE